MNSRTRQLSVRFQLVCTLVGKSMVHPRNNYRLNLRLDSQRQGNSYIHHSLHFYCNLGLLDGHTHRI